MECFNLKFAIVGWISLFLGRFVLDCDFFFLCSFFVNFHFAFRLFPLPPRAHSMSPPILLAHIRPLWFSSQFLGAKQVWYIFSFSSNRIVMGMREIECICIFLGDSLEIAWIHLAQWHCDADIHPHTHSSRRITTLSTSAASTKFQNSTKPNQIKTKRNET